MSFSAPADGCAVARARLRRRRRAWCALLATSLAATPVQALPAWDLFLGPGDMQNNFNVPKITLTNLSTAGEQIVEFRLSVGHPEFIFDFVADLSSSPAGRAANVATEALTGATLVFEIDVDPRAGGPTADARTILFDNGAHPNAVVLVRFSNGSTDIFLLPDAGAPSATYSFGGSGPFAVPEPSVATLVAVGLAALSRARRRSSW